MSCIICRLCLPEQFCQQLLLFTQCDKFIAEYGKIIIKALVDGVGPKVVCTLIHLCLGEEAKIEAFSFDMKIGECSVCEFVLEMVKDAVGENFTKVC